MFTPSAEESDPDRVSSEADSGPRQEELVKKDPEPRSDSIRTGLYLGDSGYLSAV
jgi:hypothetical protein